MNTIFVDADFRINAQLLSPTDLVQQRYDALRLMVTLSRLKGWMFAITTRRREWLEIPSVRWWFNRGRPFLPALVRYFLELDVSTARRCPETARSDIDQICNLLNRHWKECSMSLPPITHSMVAFYRQLLLNRDSQYYGQLWVAELTPENGQYPPEFYRM